MRKRTDPRHKKRQQIVESLFARSFTHQFSSKIGAGMAKNDKSSKIAKNLAEIDDLINKAAPQWPIEKIAKIDLTILRLAVFELAIEKEQPPKVVIDEAIELAKEYSGETSPSFVNGVLGTLLKKSKVKK